MPEQNDDFQQRVRIALWIYLGLVFLDQFRTRPSSAPEFWFVEVLGYLLIPTALLLRFQIFDSIGRMRIGLQGIRGQDIGLWILVACLFVLSNVVGATVGAVMDRAIPWLPKYAPYHLALLPEDALLRFFALVYLSMNAAFFEEVYFRALPYLAIQPKTQNQITIYVVVTAILFALIHWRNGFQGMIATLFVGLVAAVVFLKIRDCKSIIAGHFLMDVWIQW